jgi:hypothetical protein
MSDSASVRLPVEAVQIMLFARSIGDENPAFVELACADEMVAPPTFTETLQHFIPGYEFRPDPRRPWIGSEPTAMGVARQSAAEITLHAEQHFEYHTDVRPGDVLTATTRAGKTWEKSGRSGTLRFFERITEFRKQSGE